MEPHNTQLPVAWVVIILVRFQTVDCGQRLQYVYVNFIESQDKGKYESQWILRP